LGLSREFNYPEDLNVTSLSVNGNALVNISYLNGSWPTGYYWGELSLKNIENETSTGYLWFNVQPFRVQINSDTYSVDYDQCINSSLYVYQPDWSSNSLLVGNYSVIEVYENIWSGMSNQKISYTNYTSSSFNTTGNVSICPNSGSWGSGSWGGYHYLNVLVKDNVQNDSQSGWLSFRAIPFQTSWGSPFGGINKNTNANVVVPVSVTKPSTGANTTGNLTRLYQWRYDNYQSTLEEYIFKVGTCYSNVSSQCTVNGTQNVTIYAPSGGWKVGYNYINSEFGNVGDSSSNRDGGSLYIEGREYYNGYFDNNLNGNYKYYFSQTENLSIRIVTRDSNYDAVNVNITGVQYSLASDSCSSDWCRVYTSARYNVSGMGGNQTSNGQAILTLFAPSGGWTRGTYYIKATISSSSGTSTVTGGSLAVKDTTRPNVTISSPVNNGSYTRGSPLSINVTTSKNSQCNFYATSYNQFYTWYCSGYFGNSSNSTANASITSQTRAACNTSYYNYNSTSYYTVYVSNNYYSAYNGVNYTYSSGSTGLTTGTTSHSYSFNTTLWPLQHYGVQVWCYDSDYNYGNEQVTFKVTAT